MSKIQIMTDSASDISYADEQKYCISVIPFPITLGDKTYTSRERKMVEKVTEMSVAANSGPRVVGVSFTRKMDE